MAAPSTAYLNNGGTTLPAHKVGTVLNDNLAALLLAAYTDLAGFKALFYLDAVFAIQNGSSEGLIGAIIDGGTNSKYHATARLSVYGAFKDGIPHTLLNEPLNTLGHTDSVNCTNKQSGAHNFEAFFKSAFYCETTDHQIQAKRVGDANWKHIFFGTMAQNTSATKNSTPDPTVFDFNAGDVIDIFSDITNSEGKYPSATVQFTVTPRIYSTIFNASYASYACNNTNSSVSKTIYVSNWKLANTVILYKDSLRTDPADQGFYAISGKWYKAVYDLGTNSTTITDQDVCGTWRVGDPAYVAAYNTKTWDHYETILQGSSSGCFKYANGSTLTPKTTYKSTVNYKYYASTSAATAAGTTGYTVDGFYFEISAGVMTWIKIESGVMTDSGTC